MGSNKEGAPRTAVKIVYCSSTTSTWYRTTTIPGDRVFAHLLRLDVDKGFMRSTTKRNIFHCPLTPLPLVCVVSARWDGTSTT